MGTAVRLGPVVVTAGDGRSTRAAELEWASGSLPIVVAGPQTVLDPTDDATGMVCIALPLAMRTGERLDIEGPVSPRLLAQIETIQALYAAWDPTLHRISVDAAPRAAIVPADRRGSVSFFSRGVDSVFTAASAGPVGGGSIESLLFVDGLEPNHDASVRQDEIRLAGLAANDLELPLTVVETNVRVVTDSFGADWEDVLGAGLSFVAHAVGGRFDRVSVPSTDSYLNLDPCGSSPLLDPLFSSERVAISHHGYRYSRIGKIDWLTDHAPRLLAHLKVCARENRSDNCGRCGKCVYTMMVLDLFDRLPTARYFPPDLDLDLVRALRSPHLKSRIDLAELAAAAATCPEKADLGDAALEALRRSSLSGVTHQGDIRQWTKPFVMRNHRLNLILSLVLEGRPYPPLNGDDAGRQPRRLVQSAESGRPGVALTQAGAGPGGIELGSVTTLPLPGAIPIWITDGGLLLTRGMQVPPRGRLSTAVRWAVDPTGGSGYRRLHSAVARIRRWWSAEGIGAGTDEGNPDAYLYGEAAPGRSALYMAWHRAGWCQVLTLDVSDPVLEWCTPPMLLGYVDLPGDAEVGTGTTSQ